MEADNGFDDDDRDDDGRRDKNRDSQRNERLKIEEKQALEKNKKTIEEMAKVSEKLTEVLSKMEENKGLNKSRIAIKGAKFLITALAASEAGHALKKELIHDAVGVVDGSAFQAKIEAANQSLKLGEFLKVLYQKFLDIGNWETANSTKTVTTSGGIVITVSSFIDDNLTAKISKVRE